MFCCISAYWSLLFIQLHFLTTFHRPFSISLWAISCCTGLFSLLYQEQNVTHLHLRLCVAEHHGNRALYKIALGQQVERSYFLNVLSSQLRCHESFAYFKLGTHFFHSDPLQKALFIEIPECQCRNWCWLRAFVHEADEQELCPWLSCAGNDGHSLALSSRWHNKWGGKKPAPVINPCSLCPSSSGRGETAPLNSCPASSCQVEMGPTDSTGRLCLGCVPLNQIICNSVKAKDKYNESQEFLSIWKCFPKWLKLNFIRRNP